MNFAGFAQNYTPKPFGYFISTTGGAALTRGY
jgi:hypothetical protein